MEKDLKIPELIPQKAPFVMIDGLKHFQEDAITSTFTIKEENIFCVNNHLSEPGIIENMAQTVALHTGYSYFLKNEKPPIGYIGSIKNIEIVSLPKVNDVLQTSATILHEFMGVTLVNIEVFLNSEKIAFGEMKTVIAK